MSIRARAITRVIIGGEWFSVQMGSFEVVDMAFDDEEGEPIHDPIDVKAYSFKTPNNDHYYGPLSAITLMKLAEI